MKEFNNEGFKAIYDFTSLLIELDKKEMYTNSEVEIKQIQEINNFIKKELNNKLEKVILTDGDCYLIENNILFIKKIISSNGNINHKGKMIPSKYNIQILNSLEYKIKY